MGDQWACMTLLLHALQDSDADSYLEYPLMFNIQNEGLSALLQYNLDAANRTFNKSDPNFVVKPPCLMSLSFGPSRLAFLPRP